MNYKNYTRSPQYGKIYSYDEKGKQVHELNILGLELEHEGKEYTVAGLLESVTEHSLEITRLKGELRHQESIDDGFRRRITELEQKNKILIQVIEKLTAEVSRIKSTNKGI